MARIDMQSFLESMVDQLQPEDLDGLKYVWKENFTGKFHSDFAASREYLEYFIMKQFSGLASYINYDNKQCLSFVNSSLLRYICLCDVGESRLSHYCKVVFAKYALEPEIESYHRLNNSRKLKILLFHLMGREHSVKNHT